MKKLIALLGTALVGMSLLSGCASEVPEEADEEEEVSEAQTLTVSDPDYYTRFKGQNLSINVYNWGEYISTGSSQASRSTTQTMPQTRSFMQSSRAAVRLTML